MDLTAIAAAAIMFILGATSPGPSVAVVLRNTMIGGRARGLSCAVGHGIGFGFYAISVVFGLVIIMEKYPDVFTIMQAIGIFFLLYLGKSMLSAEVQEIQQAKSNRDGFLEGFFIAFLNPKIVVFMLAVLSTVLDSSMNSETKRVIAGLGMTIDTVWYVLVAIVLSNSSILTRIQNNQRILNLITGLLMIGLAIWTAVRLLTQ